ncbi:MAG: TonB-dependent receptor [Pseudomonadota bacterium]
MRQFVRSAAVLAVAAATSQYASAQLEEVLVTATKRQESLQDVGVAVSAFSSEAIRDEGIVAPRDLFNRVPNVQLQTNSANGQMQLSIRGISFPTFSPIGVQPVVMFQDEIAMTSPQTAGMYIFDLERIEVLRGPQNTLYGRNTTGGAVNFISVRPEVGGETNGFADLTVGNFGAMNLNAAVGGPIGDLAAYRLSFQSLNHDGYWDNELDVSSRLGDREQNIFRAQVLVEPSDTFSALINVHGGRSDGSSRPVKAHGFTEPGTDVPYSCNDIDLDDFKSTCEDGFGGETLSGTDRAFGGISNDLDDTDAWGGSIRLDRSFEGFDFMSLTGFETNEWDKWEDNSGLRAPILVGFRQKADTDQVTHEFRLTSNSDSPLQWIGGFYYHYDEVEFYTSVPITIVPFAPAGFGNNGLFRQETTMYSLFGQVDYALNDNLTLIAGLRWVSEEKDGVARAQEGDWGDAILSGALDFERPDDWLFDNLAQYNIIEPVRTPFSETWDDLWGGKLGIEYMTDDGQLFYAHVTRGEKGGQFADAPDSVIAGSFITPAAPEEVLAYEAGFKAIFLDDTLQFNVAAFFNDYSNQQVQISFVNEDGDLVSQVVNAAESEIYGLEAEIIYAPGDGWQLELGLGLLRSEVVEDSLGPATGGALTIEEGRNLNNAPETTFNFGLTKEFQLADGSVLSGRVDGRYVSEREFNLIDTVETRPFTTDPSYMIFNARLDYRFGGAQQYRASLWGKNLTDDLYFNRFEDIGTSNLGYPGDPRTYGLTVGMDF